MYSFLLVFLGGGMGSVCRWGLGTLISPLAARFPWATLAANGLACLVLGAVIGWQTTHTPSDDRRLLLAVGFCGGFSTFSTFTAETYRLWQNDAHTLALLNVSGSLLVCFVCLILGLTVVTKFT